MERHGLQFGMCLSPPSSDDFRQSEEHVCSVACAKPETGWKLLSLWQHQTTCQVKRDRVTFLVVRILQYRPVSDVCTYPKTKS